MFVIGVTIGSKFFKSFLCSVDFCLLCLYVLYFINVSMKSY